MALRSVNPRTGEAGRSFEEATPADVARAASAAADAFPAWRDASGEMRARALRAMAEALADERRRLVEVADEETALGAPRLNGELDRTTGQLRMFADLVERGSHVEAILSPGDATLTPPRPDLRRMLVPIGPVGVFPPCNFPLAFGVAGGDTASAIAAGCPVIVKGHPSHPGTSELCAAACEAALVVAGAPPGVIGLVQGGAPEVSRAVIQAPEIKAIGFTGSLAVGRMLHDLAAARPEPIPFHGELGSINPVFVGEAALAARGEAVAATVAASVLLGAGQFCTKPGVIFAPLAGEGGAFAAALARALDASAPMPLLNAGLEASLGRRVHQTRSVPGVRELTSPGDGAGHGVVARLFLTDLATFRREPALQAEHFGPAALLVRASAADALDEAARLDGQLTATLVADDGDEAWARAMVARLIDRVGRVIVNGVPTGVAVVPAMQHGGPYPSSTAPLHTSVGTTAIRRFLRPVAFQGVPDAWLPPALQGANPLGIERLIDGVWTRRPLGDPTP